MRGRLAIAEQNTQLLSDRVRPTALACCRRCCLFANSCAKGKLPETNASSFCAGIKRGSDVARLLLQNFAGSHAKAVTALSLTCSLSSLEGEHKGLRGGLSGPQPRLTVTPAAWGF